MVSEECLLNIFTKAPVPGKVKTRLIPTLGEDDAAKLYQSLLNRTLETAKQAGIANVQLWCTPTIEHSYLKACADRFSVGLRLQEGNDLGERMYFAVEDSLNRGNYVLIIGADCPELSADDLHLAYRKLRQKHDIVLGPAEDGGYYLIGVKSVRNELFTDIQWGSSKVLSTTRDRLKKMDLSSFELCERWDVDRPEDLERFYRLLIVEL